MTFLPNDAGLSWQSRELAAPADMSIPATGCPSGNIDHKPVESGAIWPVEVLLTLPDSVCGGGILEARVKFGGCKANLSGGRDH